VDASRFADCGAGEEDENGDRGDAEAGAEGCAVGPAGKTGAEFPFEFAAEGFDGRAGAVGNPPTLDPWDTTWGPLVRRVSQSETPTNAIKKTNAAITGKSGFDDPRADSRDLVDACRCSTFSIDTLVTWLACIQPQNWQTCLPVCSFH